MLSYSISTGIAAGVLIYFLVNSAALAMSTYKTKVGKSFEVNDDEMPAAEHVKEIKSRNPDFKARVFNPVMISLVALAVVYFATMPLYY